ncbi:MAG: nicotinate-nicotinamide nucleotide adenylyltransferase [Planctomycetes bacterium]|nr:nicotinate-nicotinamide nucleotide adenylyltransferase [Planctomycetota bacterium]
MVRLSGPRIALFGGAFDPPHLGHVLAATWAHCTAEVDEVWILPTAKHAYGKPMAPWAQRWELCQAAFAGLGFAHLRDDELRNPEGFTITLLERLRAAHPGHRWLLVGGTDTSRDLPNWHRGAELAGLVEVIAVPRRGYDDMHPGALPAISSTLVRERLRAGAGAGELLPARVGALIAERGWYR